MVLDDYHTDFRSVLRQVQSGYLYHYAFAMILGVLLFLADCFGLLLVLLDYGAKNAPNPPYIHQQHRSIVGWIRRVFAP